MRPAAYNAKARLQDMDTDGIDLAVLYPTSMLGLQSIADEEFAGVQARAYNDWASDHTQEGEGRLFAAGAVPPMNDEAGVQAVADEIRRVAEKPGMVSVFLRPNPSVDWRPFNDKVYDPVWQAAADTGLVLAFHPFLDARPAGRVPRSEAGAAVRRLELRAVGRRNPTEGWEMGNILFTQAIANPVDVMHSIAYITAGGVCERFPDTKFLFLEANGGWLVPVARAARPPLEEVRVGRAVAEHAPVGVLPAAVLDQLRPRRVDARVHGATRRCAVPTASCGRRTTRTPTPSSPASPRSWPRRSSRCRTSSSA